jgi:ribonuclease HI
MDDGVGMSEGPRVAEVMVYTDGGADPNPGPGGWGVVLVHPASGRTEEMRGGEPRTTNNRMELTAALVALDALKLRCRVALYTDSQYLRRGVTEWLPGWIARGWRRKTGELQNEDLWRRLAAVTVRHEVTWHWIKGHAGHARNERADQLASAAIVEQRAALRLERAAAAGPGTGPAAPAPDIDVYLRISRSRQGAGWAALVRRRQEAAGEERVVSGSLAAGATVSANAVDLLAATAVLESLPAGAHVAVHTGSDYLRHGASRWLPGWRQRGWKTKEGGAVMNRELWERLAAAMARRTVEWPEVKDSEPQELERLGKLARAAAGGEAKQPDSRRG